MQQAGLLQNSLLQNRSLKATANTFHVAPLEQTLNGETIVRKQDGRRCFPHAAITVKLMENVPQKVFWPCKVAAFYPPHTDNFFFRYSNGLQAAEKRGTHSPPPSNRGKQKRRMQKRPSSVLSPRHMQNASSPSSSPQNAGSSPQHNGRKQHQLRQQQKKEMAIRGSSKRAHTRTTRHRIRH